MMMLDAQGDSLLRAHDASFHRWQQCIGEHDFRWADYYARVNDLYDHLCLLDDMWDVAAPACIGLDIELFRRWRKSVNARLAKVAADPNPWITRGRRNNHVYSDVCGALRNTLRPLLYKTVSREDCMEF